MVHDQLSYEIIGAAHEVHNTLGAGFLEKVYEHAMVVELEQRGLQVQQQHPIPVSYKGVQVGEYFADLLVEDQIIIELKAVEKIAKIHEVQLVNYLQGINLEIGLLINFGSTVMVKRKYRTYNK